MLLWLNYFDSVLSGRLWENRPNDEKMQFWIFPLLAFCKAACRWLLSGEVLFQEFKWSANLGRWWSSLADSHTLSLHVVSRRSSVQFLPLNYVGENVTPSACVEQTTLFNTHLLFYEDFLCVPLQVKNKITLNSRRPFSEPRCVQRQRGAACVRGMLAALLAAFGTAVLK